MKKNIIFIMMLLCYFLIEAQNITLLDIETGKPIYNVLVSSKQPQASGTTNEGGHLPATQFKHSEKINFSHVGYKTAEYTYKQIEALNYVVTLEPKITTLQTFSITASRFEQIKQETPARITTINIREAAFQNPQTTADLLGASGYVFIQKSQLGGGSPMLRGMATNRVLLVVDGVRMNNAIFRSGNLQNVISIDANALESAEVLFGPGSVMYGSDAVGGVMNFGTLQAKFSRSGNSSLDITGNALSRFSTANGEKTNHIDLNFGGKKWAFLTSITFSDYGDLRSGSKGGRPFFYRNAIAIRADSIDIQIPNADSTLQVGSQFHQWNIMQKIRFKPNNKWEFDYAFHFSETSPFNRYDRLFEKRNGGLRWAEWYYGPQKWQMHRVAATFNAENKFFDRAKWVVAYQFFEESRFDRRFNNNNLNIQKETVNAVSVNLDFEKKLTEKMIINYGFESVNNLVGSVGETKNIQSGVVLPALTRYPDGANWLSNGVYATAQYRILPKILLSGGIRFNDFRLSAAFDTTFFPFPFTSTRMQSNAISGNFGIVLTPTENSQIYFNYAHGMRAPNVDDMGKVFESEPGFLIVPNPNLKTEKVHNLELGVVWRAASWLTIDATGYYTLLTGAMARQNFTFNSDTSIFYLGELSRIQAIQNVTEAHVYGVQAGIEMYFKGFGFKSNYSYQKGREQTPDSLKFYPLRHAAPAFGSTHFTYEYRNKFKIDFYLQYNAAMRFDDLALTERVSNAYARDSNGKAFVDAWTTYNLKIAFFPNPFVSISLGVENISDLLYRPYSSGINAPGRNFITSLRVKF